MTLRHESSSCVAAGTFNIYILTPDWLTKIGLVESGTQFQFEVNLSEPGHRFESASLPYRWTVHPNRLIVESKDKDANCGDQVAAIIDKLPWTPLKAIGSNSTFIMDNAKLPSLLQTVVNHVGGKPDVDKSGVVASIKQESRTFNLHVSISEGDVRLHANVHVQLDREQDIAAQATTVSRRFFQDREAALTLFKSHFGLEID